MADASPDFRHSTPDELQAVLADDSALLAKWNDLTPLAQNEWICWVTSPKKQETRDAHLARLKEDILSGKKRPCCWPGCPHRRESARKWFN
jgi:uncharacterized protein YdeI (YjbR/CyaY-like superfamily)